MGRLSFDSPSWADHGLDPGSLRFANFAGVRVSGTRCHSSTDIDIVALHFVAGLRPLHGRQHRSNVGAVPPRGVDFRSVVIEDGLALGGLTELTQLLRKKLERSGHGHMPLWASEVALNAPWHKEVASWWRKKPPAERASAVVDWIAAYRQLGWRAVFTYGTDNTEDFLGLPQSTPEVAAAFSRAYRESQRA